MVLIIKKCPQCGTEDNGKFKIITETVHLAPTRYDTKFSGVYCGNCNAVFGQYPGDEVKIEEIGK